MQSQVASQQSLSDTLKSDLTTLEAQVPDCLSKDGNADWVFEGCNVHVLVGSGRTDGLVNGEGNLIIGYSEELTERNRSGSHNLVIGPDHSDSSYGGLVVGCGNVIICPSSSVAGSATNTSSEDSASATESTVGSGSSQTNTTDGTFLA